MSYVDWVAHNYAGGDYSMVRAFLVAYEIDDAVKAEGKSHGKRYYSTGRREDSETRDWSNLALVEYKYEREEGLTRYTAVEDFAAQD